MAKQTFTVGQVLTAAQMTSLQQTALGGGSTTAKTASYTLVAADAGTVVQMNSASATTITVNTALFAAGDTVQIQNVGSGVCTVTAGTATVSTSSTLALKQYDAGSLYFNTTSAAIFFAVDAADSTSPLTTKGDLYTYSTVDARLPVGTNKFVLGADSTQTTGLAWQASPQSTLTTTGDIIYASAANTPARLGIGSASQVLTVASGIPSWATPASGSTYVGASISMSAVQSIPNTTDTMLSWDTEQWDTNAIHASGSPTRMTVPTGYGGKWRVSGQILTGTGTGGVEISIYVNGTRYVAGTPNFAAPFLASSRGAFVTMNLELNLSAADYVQLECWQNSGGALNVLTASRYQFSYIGA